MLKKTVFIGAMLVVLCVCSVVFAKAIKLELLPADGWNWLEEPEESAWGRAVVNYAKADDITCVQINCWGLEPETEYHVIIGMIGSPYADLGYFTTNKKGCGCLHGEFDGEPPDMRIKVRNEDHSVGECRVLRTDKIPQL